ncbi:DUF2550 family protein [Motilibacter peucedani]|uniref:DUF2550 family protein n=1 Tax=Motilibacter peucedani TaxID=598650 RepID=UPI0038B3B2BE
MALGAAGFAWVVARRGRAMARESRVECGFRVMDGSHAGLSRRWRHGAADLDTGYVRFTPFVGGLRFLRRPSVVIELDGIETGEPRRPELREAVFLSPGARVVAVRSSGARLEWALPVERLDWAVAAVDR